MLCSIVGGIEGQRVLKFECTQLYSFSGTPRVLVAGGKGVGKSSFLRCYVNRLRAMVKAQSVLYLDLDPGQPE